VNTPLVDAIGEKYGAYIRGGDLVLRLDRTRKYPIPERALKWLEERLGECPDCRKYVRVFERGGELVVQQQRMASALERMAGLQNPGQSIAEELERLKRLLDQGAITREEYEELKKKILGVEVDR